MEVANATKMSYYGYFYQNTQNQIWMVNIVDSQKL